MSVFNFVCTGDKKFSCGFSFTGRKLHVDGIKYMVAIHHYLCHAGNKEIFFFVWCYLRTFSIILISLFL